MARFRETSRQYGGNRLHLSTNMDGVVYLGAMKYLQMTRGHTSGQLCYVESEPLWMKLAITPNGFRSTQLSSIHSPQTWHERPCSHDRHMRTARWNQRVSYPKGWRYFIPMPTGPGLVSGGCLGWDFVSAVTTVCQWARQCCMVNLIANWKWARETSGPLIWTQETGYALLWSAWLAMVKFLPEQVISGNLEWHWHAACKWRCLQDTMITLGHSGRLRSSLAHK